jgi:transcriptional regulator with XRE-family HTH domain
MRTRKRNSEVAVAFGAVLRELREARGLSQEALADLANCDRTYPSILERGLRTPTITSIFILADALEMKASELVELTAAKLMEGE